MIPEADAIFYFLTGNPLSFTASTESRAIAVAR
jgi:hypothetical protein